MAYCQNYSDLEHQAMINPQTYKQIYTPTVAQGWGLIKNLYGSRSIEKDSNYFAFRREI